MPPHCCMGETSPLEGARVRSEWLLEIGRNDSLVPSLSSWLPTAISGVKLTQTRSHCWSRVSDLHAYTLTTGMWSVNASRETAGTQPSSLNSQRPSVSLAETMLILFGARRLDSQ